MALFRWIVGMPMAALVTAGLFLLMAQLIRDKVIDLPPPTDLPRINITAQEPVDDQFTIKPPSKTIPEEIPPTDFEYKKTSEAPKGPVVKPVRQKTPTTPPGPGGVFGPTIKITPPYPEACRSRGAAGIVIVEFDVTPEGNVTNARVIETPNACFVRPIIKAVSGWKYSPAAGSGMRYGVVETFNFQLTD